MSIGTREAVEFQPRFLYPSSTQLTKSLSQLFEVFQTQNLKFFLQDLLLISHMKSEKYEGLGYRISFFFFDNRIGLVKSDLETACQLNQNLARCNSFVS